MIIVLSGPGGAGKGTVARRLVEQNSDIYLAKSWTTRPRRTEEDENAYTFVDEETFRNQIQSDLMMEWIQFGGHYYGTPFSELNTKEKPHILLEIDVEGAKRVREAHPETILIFLEAPTAEAQRQRLQKRGDSEEHVVQRINYAAKEREEAKKLEAVWIINDDVETAAKEIGSIIETK